MVPIKEYLMDGTFPEICAEAVKVKAQVARYSLLNGVLYRRSFSGPYLRCLLRGVAMLVMSKFTKVCAERTSEEESCATKL